MADVKPEVLVAEIADGIYVKFQLNLHICWVEHQGRTNISTIRPDVRASDKSKMAACNRKWKWNNVYLG